jgi:hypothetical protein
MAFRGWIIIGVIWVASLIGVAVTVSAQAQAQAYLPLPEPKVMSGADVGFRVDGLTGETPTGTVVVRVNGRWVDAILGAGRTR